MTDAAVILHGQPSSWCRECKKKGESTTGNYQCSQPFGKCLYPVPKLSIEDYLIIELLKMCRNKWNLVGGFGYERRVGIPFSDVEIAARFIGVKLNKTRIRKFLLCEDALISDDLNAINESKK